MKKSGFFVILIAAMLISLSADAQKYYKQTKKKAKKSYYHGKKAPKAETYKDDDDSSSDEDREVFSFGVKVGGNYSIMTMANSINISVPQINIPDFPDPDFPDPDDLDDLKKIEKASFSGISSTSTFYGIGFEIGGFAEYRFSKYFSLYGEAAYTIYDMTMVQSLLGVSLKLNYQMHSVAVPVLFKWYIYEGLFMHVGPQVEFNISSSGKLNGTKVEAYEPNFFVLLANAGVGYNFGRFFIDIRGNMNITPYIDIPKLAGTIDLGGNASQNTKISLSLNLGVKF